MPYVITYSYIKANCITKPGQWDSIFTLALCGQIKQMTDWWYLFPYFVSENEI